MVKKIGNAGPHREVKRVEWRSIRLDVNTMGTKGCWERRNIRPKSTGEAPEPNGEAGRAERHAQASGSLPRPGGRGAMPQQARREPG
jgi:hypothetical protein